MDSCYRKFCYTSIEQTRYHHSIKDITIHEWIVFLENLFLEFWLIVHVTNDILKTKRLSINFYCMIFLFEKKRICIFSECLVFINEIILWVLQEFFIENIKIILLKYRDKKIIINI